MLIKTIIGTYCWIMCYNVVLGDAKKLIFFNKKIIQCGDGDEAGIPEPVGDGDEIQFLIPVGYG